MSESFSFEPDAHASAYIDINAEPGPGVFNDFASAYNALAARTANGKTLYVGGNGDLFVPNGDWDMSDIRLMAVESPDRVPGVPEITAERSNLTFESDEARLLNIWYLAGFRILSGSTCTLGGDCYLISCALRGGSVNPALTQPTGDQALIIWNTTLLEDSGGAEPAISVTDGDLFLRVWMDSNVNANSLRARNITYTNYSVFSSVDTSQADQTGTSIMQSTLGGPFMPTTPADWGSSPPTTLQEALDLLAANTTIP